MSPRSPDSEMKPFSQAQPAQNTTGAGRSHLHRLVHSQPVYIQPGARPIGARERLRFCVACSSAMPSTRPERASDHERTSRVTGDYPKPSTTPISPLDTACLPCSSCLVKPLHQVFSQRRGLRTGPDRARRAGPRVPYRQHGRLRDAGIGFAPPKHIELRHEQHYPYVRHLHIPSAENLRVFFVPVPADASGRRSRCWLPAPSLMTRST